MTGDVERYLARDHCAARWPVLISAKDFAAAAREHAGGASARGRASASGGPRVVVLSPDAPECLTDVRRDTVYVVGGLCDYKRIANATLDRAAAAKVEARRLPLREAFGNNFSVNILTVNQARSTDRGRAVPRVAQRRGLGGRVREGAAEAEDGRARREGARGGLAEPAQEREEERRRRRRNRRRRRRRRRRGFVSVSLSATPLNSYSLLATVALL
ncbi:uncharacterized protein MICPUCDRAFT_70247 [Micromonas pusilla CCMP1545]|uniref:tRNA (guanine(9)-N(1))-methyltransferase n=1 Tax=Micromonas pusilla (strain CCMP1545) TaxID=564608 RepID=C1MWP7_MICPC|nr:uncharacterized protein MICPUCDRAFT_70247 [Micromonas pusilla CCMP1545]EEH55915.1 predicted protein [Micromonas pusilla CCMP1545]|eukprot:XP_003059963.1 predicted protein [Micromonas pusilla CCMP1545]